LPSPSILYKAFKMVLDEKFPKSLLQFIDGTVIVNARFLMKIYEGKAFSVSHRFEGVASGASVDMLFENPSGSNTDIYVIIIEIVTFAQGWVDIYRNVTVTASGTTLTPVNLNLSSTNQSVAHVEYGGTYSTPATPALNTVVPGGSLVRAIGGATEVGECLIMPEGSNILVRVTNQSASAQDLSVRILWWEDTVT